MEPDIDLDIAATDVHESDNGAARLGLDGVYSHSQIQSFLGCERQYTYHYRDGWRSAIASRPMTLGNVTHHLLDLWWTGTDIADIVLDDVAQYTMELQETKTIEECISIAEHSIWLMRRYDKMYARDRETIKVIEVEKFRTFELPQIGDRRFGIIVKIDKLLESAAHQGIVMLDHKVTGQMPKEDWIDIEPQFSMYHLALRETGVDVVASLLDTIYSYRNRKKGEFVAWDDPKYPVESSFSRVPTDRSDAMLDIVAEEAYRACERMWSLREGKTQPLRSITAACLWCAFRAPCYEGLQGDKASELAVLQEHFDGKKRPPVMSSSPFTEEVEI